MIKKLGKPLSGVNHYWLTYVPIIWLEEVEFYNINSIQLY